MNIESFKNLALAACVALSAATACSKKEDAAPEIRTISRDVMAASMCSVGEKDVKTENEVSGIKVIPPPAVVEKTVPERSISVGDLPVANWFDAVKYDGCEGLDLRKQKDLDRTMKDCKFYDPNGVDGKGLPVLDLRGHYRDKLGSYFRVSDFAKIDPSDLQYVNPGHRETTDDGAAVYRFARIDPAIVSLMNEIREEAGFPIFIDGGFRPYYHNVRMYKGQGGGVKSKSQHVSGSAVDIDLNLTFGALREKCAESGFAKSDKGKTACRLKNKSVLSEHLFGTAYEIMQKRGGGGIGMGDTQIHFDSRNGGRVAMWGYNSWNRKMIGRLMKTPGRGKR